MTAGSATSIVSKEIARSGHFVRQPNRFTDRITADGSSGYAAEPGRYHLYVSLACPWAQRAVIVRGLMGLEDVISLSVVDPIRDERGWRFADPDEPAADYDPDPANGFRYLAQAYAATDPGYSGRVTVPAIWDRNTGRIVTNDFPVITPTFEVEFAHLATTDVDLYPAELRADIEAVSAPIYEHVNNGVYKAGFATTQEAYEEAFDALFAHLDVLEERLSRQRFLVGDRLTDADVRLFTTLVRFDAVYYSHFKCNLRRLVDYPALWGYARDLYQRPAFSETTNFDHIKRHYYATHERLNPNRIVPKGPAIDWRTPHGRS
jgi:glutathionyl-hydroquinone reductase